MAKGSDHIARLWASDRVLELMRADPAGNRAAAVALATQYRLVTPVSGAVVLETKQQYDESRLTPVSQATVPTVPEPHEWALLLIACAALSVVGLAQSAAVRGGSVMHPLLLAALVAAATWDAWRWYLARVSAAPEEAAALALTVAFLGMVGVARQSRSASPRPLPLVPSRSCSRPTPRAMPSCRRSSAPPWRSRRRSSVFHLAAFRERPPIAFWGLVALALPVLPSLQFTLGYPMRVVSAALTVGLLQAHGLMVARQGTFLVWRDEMVQFDAPCSGVNMLWAGLLLTLMGCVLLRLGALKVVIAVVLSVALAIAGNVLRASSLFYVESGLVPHAPGWWHDGIGVVAFVLSAAVTLWLLGRLRDRETLIMEHMRSIAVAAVLISAAAAALAPLAARPGGATSAADGNFPGWPTHHEGRALTEMPLTQRELAFVHDFPGRVGRFSDGRREIIIRWVGAPTRRLHPAADCFRGSGYSVTPMPVGKDAAGAAMGCFRASHGADT